VDPNAAPNHNAVEVAEVVDNTQEEECTLGEVVHKLAVVVYNRDLLLHNLLGLWLLPK
jgi:hypothetical protein